MRTSTAEQNGGTACVTSDGSHTQSCSVECPGKIKYIAKRYNSFYPKPTLSVNCQWGDWQVWSSCGDSCSAADGTGDQTRTRTSTPAENSGTACVAADGSDTQSCSVDCPGKIKYIVKRQNYIYSKLTLLVNCQWGNWQGWSSCEDSCSAADGTGDQTRTRFSTPAANSGIACVVAEGSDTQSCTVECPGKTTP